MNKTNYHSIKVLIADDHAMLRMGFRNMFRRQPEIEFTGEAENGRELVQLAAKLQPDIIFTDISMPVMDGIEATRRVHTEHPDIGIIALTSYDDDNLIVNMLEAGARGYLLKNSSRKEILDAIYTVYEKGTYYCRTTSTKLVNMIAASRFNPNKKKKQVDFTEREKEVIRLICKEYSNKEMAALLALSVRTIEGYREKIQEKMDVHSTAGLVVYAIQKGIYKPS